jgi:hypothetical protein
MSGVWRRGFLRGMRGDDEWAGVEVGMGSFGALYNWEDYL